MANDLPQKQPESHVEGSSTTDDTESNNAPTLEASAKESLKSARNKKLYLGGAVAALLVVVIVVIVTVVVLGDGIRGDGKSDTRAATNSQSADGMVPSATLVEDRATRITNFINNIKLSTDIGALKVPTQSLLEQGLALPPNTCRFDCILTPATLSPEGELNGTDPYVSTICGVPSTTATMEEQALAWLVHDDPLQLVPDSAKHQFQLQQRYALLTLLLQHPFFLFDIANNSAPFHECEWTSGSFKGYVENCTSLSPRAAVTVLDSGEGCFLPGSTLSPDLGLLSDLVSFNVPLSGNLVGSLPETLARWSNLQNFGIEDGSLTGTIPAALGPAWGKTLDAFGVADNRLLGSLPDSLRAWTNLRYFSVSGNQLTGTIPSALNDWSRARPQKLQTAYFDDNRFTGSIPSEFCNTDNGHNHSFFGLAVSSLGQLGADCDRVSCPCCNSCRYDNDDALVEDRATRITNFINGIKLSTDVGALKVPTQSLLGQDLALPPDSCRYSCLYTGAYWTFPPQGEGNGTAPEASYLTTGCGVPSTTATLEDQALSWLVHDDPLQLVPDTAEQQFQLQQRYALLTLFLQFPFFLFDISNNTAPFHECDWISNVYGGYVRNCSSLSSSSLSSQRVITVIDTFEACILPGTTLSPDLGLLSDLVSFSVPLTENLGGSLPETLAQWSNLQYFAVNDAALTGTIPAAFGTAWGKTLDSFTVTSNRLSGSLPDSLRAWTNLRYFSVMMNQLTGSIPSALNDWSRARPQKLEIAYFNDNLFTGSIPSEFCSTDNGYNNSFFGLAVASLGQLGADCDRVSCPCCNSCRYDNNETV